MTDNKGKPADEGGGNDDSADDGNKSPDSSYKKLKDSHEKLEDQLKSQENAHQASNRKQEDRIKALETANEAPREDTERIADLEVKLARSEAVSRYGLSPDDAALLKGSPDDILESAEYWATRIKDNKSEDKKKEEDKSNKEIIDDKLKEDENQNNQRDQNGNLIPPKKPEPKKSGLKWIDQYNLATPAERYKMDQDVQAGLVNPTK